MKEEILNRRDFFKKSIKKTLPILVGASMFSSFISCDKDDDEFIQAIDDAEGGGGGCSG